MPPKGSKKKGGRKAKAAVVEEIPNVEPEVETPQEDTQMNVDEQTTTEQPEASTSAKLASTVTNAVVEAEHAVEHAVEKVVEKVAEVGGAAKEFVEEMTMTGVESGSSGNASESATPGAQESGKDEPMEQDSSREASQSAEAESKPKLTLEERRAKMEALRKKMREGTMANRQSLAEETAKAKLTARELARLERQRKLAETLRLKADAEERGEDVERRKNWEYTIEENDEWEKKLARKKRRADFEFHDDAQASRRRYKKDLDQIKPDLEAYNRQKALAMGLNPSANALTSFSSTDVVASSSSSALQAVSSEEQRIAAENLYRDANTLIYGDSKPSDEAIDRVVGKINKDIDKKAKFHRKRLNEDEGDITYINEHNRVFNKKIARYYDKYTAEIRASFERGTAL
ncbi:pre-mRNA-splicing factor SYF2 [Coprinopsis cinerea okayama7|uniref:Pre-mRNA-splicing factor SYF2 n=1 Tax=Coprinopsis cinerea (strain Okayama-7 / 130 / ATCC MYA-4618 / FGSC 9003) TaxID=240176 RepID=A8P0J3_COPC7|nr:pre-mRNA-splicing factor SYF2 [Coprinopsis cinerea okayama7\|eukprot:XP_001837904.1 pre-mRNA-splicing factor SYF2 [Coprinopsis cinerea okayama7\